MTENLYLAHHGVVGQKWGVRRYQNPDGTLTRAGRKHRGLDPNPRKTDPVKDAKRNAKAAKIKAKQDAKLAVAKAKQDAKLSKIKTEQDIAVAKIKSESFKKTPDDLKFKGSTFKNLDQMNDEELASAIRRLQMEDQYRKLMNAPVHEIVKVQKQETTQDKMQKVARNASTAGAEMVKKALLTAGQEKMTDLARYGITKGINALFQDEVISTNNGNKKKYLADKVWADSGYKSDYDPKTGKKNKYSEAYDNGKNRNGSTLYALMTRGELTADSLSKTELKTLVDFTKDLSSVKSNTDKYTGKKKNDDGLSRSEVEDIVKEILDNNKD